MVDLLFDRMQIVKNGLGGLLAKLAVGYATRSARFLVRQHQRSGERGKMIQIESASQRRMNARQHKCVSWAMLIHSSSAPWFSLHFIHFALEGSGLHHRAHGSTERGTLFCQAKSAAQPLHIDFLCAFLNSFLSNADVHVHVGCGIVFGYLLCFAVWMFCLSLDIHPGLADPDPGCWEHMVWCVSKGILHLLLLLMLRMLHSLFLADGEFLCAPHR